MTTRVNRSPNSGAATVRAFLMGAAISAALNPFLLAFAADAPPAARLRYFTRNEAEFDVRLAVECWALQLAAQTPLREDQEPLGRPLFRQLRDRWIEKVLALKEVLGRTNPEELDWSPVEKEWLELLREARRELPLFTATERSIQARAAEYKWFLRPENHDETQFPPAVREQWKAIDRAKYEKVVVSWSGWFQEESARRITPEQMRNYQLRKRCEHLISNLRTEMVQKHGLTWQKGVGVHLFEWLNAFLKKAETLDVLDATHVKSDDALEPFEPRERILLNYLHTSQRLNSLFTGLEKYESESDWRNRAFKDLQNPSLEEAREKQRAFSAMEAECGLVTVAEAKPAAEPAKVVASVPTETESLRNPQTVDLTSPPDPAPSASSPVEPSSLNRIALGGGLAAAAIILASLSRFRSR